MTAAIVVRTEAGQRVQRPDSADLQKALNGLRAADVTQAYRHLLAAPRGST